MLENDEQTDPRVSGAKAPGASGLTIADIPVLLVGPNKALYEEAGQKVESISLSAAADLVTNGPVLTLNAEVLRTRLKMPARPLFDVLELYAFVRPAVQLVPTVGEIRNALHLELELSDAAAIIRAAAIALIEEAGSERYGFQAGAAATAKFMADAGWPWGPYILASLASAPQGRLEPFSTLPEWQEGPLPEPPAKCSVEPKDAVRRLDQLTGDDAEVRPAQASYTEACCTIFAPRENTSAPNVAFLEAGTGIGKTLGYIAPASLWAEESGGTVWLSTYTKNLQRQLDQELSRLYPDVSVKATNAVTRKGRENYLCLLNLEEAMALTSSPARDPRERILLGLVLRWVRASRDGDMVGGDFPAWLGGGAGRGMLGGLTDRRGECTYAACAHYRRCFIERSKRAARRARLVVANHALVLSEAVSRAGDPTAPTRLVFDEGHQLFDAADSVFAVHLSGAEMSELRRWLLGASSPTSSAVATSGRAQGRARGLKARIGDLIADDEAASALLAEVQERATILTDAGWLKRLRTGHGLIEAENFLFHVRAHVLARADARGGRHSLESVPLDLEAGLLDVAGDLRQALDQLHRPITLLAARLRARLDDTEITLESAARIRLEAAVRGLDHRAEMIAVGWIPLLDNLARPATEGDTEQPFVDWFSVARIDGREIDVGCFRHWLDPTLPLAEVLSGTAHGIVVTSATLSDTSQADGASTWQAADLRLGAQHFIQPPQRARFPSPFAYDELTRVVVVGDVNKNDADQVADAYRRLFVAARGGGLGIFTAIERLRRIYGRIVGPLEEAGLPLLAQHVDAMDTGTLVDIFRADEDSCLLGTDAVRDGVDVPGRSLRLIVFDRVPWPRPTILHKSRRAHFGGRSYDEMVTRLKLKQAYGRLVRRASDRGIFIVLDAATPTRILAALPGDVVPQRMGLEEALALTRDFLDD